jgi:hypothetical protein
MKNILDPIERVRVQALFKTCQDLVKESQDELAKFENVVPVSTKSKGIGAKLERLGYVWPIGHTDWLPTQEHLRSVRRCCPMLTDVKGSDSNITKRISRELENVYIRRSLDLALDCRLWNMSS